MSMHPVLAVETFPELTEQAAVECRTASHEDAFGLLRTGTARLGRDDWQTIEDALDRRNDLLRLDAPDGSTLIRGRYDDVSREDGGDRAVTVASAEKDALQGARVPENTLQQSGNARPALAISDMFSAGDVPGTLTERSIYTTALEVNADELTYGGASPGESIRRLATLVGGEVYYGNTLTGDPGKFPLDVYQDAEVALSLGKYNESLSRGRWRVDSVTVSPSSGLVGDLSISEDSRVEITHLQGYGRGRDTTQLTAEVVADFYDGGRKVYGETIRTDVNSQSLLTTLLETEMEEMNRERRHLEVDASTNGFGLELGDFVTVQIPGEGIDRVMRVVELTDRYDEDGHVQDVVFSTRHQTRSRERERRPDRAISEFEKGFTATSSSTS